VCRRTKQMLPAMSIRMALMTVSGVVVIDDSLRLPTTPRLKISSSAPKIIPLTPASDSMRLVANEKQWIAPKEQIRLMPRTTRKTVLRLDGMVRGYTLAMGIVSRLMMRLTTPPITKKTAARSTNPCFTGEITLIIFEPRVMTALRQLSVIILRRNHSGLVENFETDFGS
jgi:hypothetical protein